MCGCDAGPELELLGECLRTVSTTVFLIFLKLMSVADEGISEAKRATGKWIINGEC
jgi:hypothetical protein